MANLTSRDKRILEDYLQMSGGNLLDFGHRTMDEFFDDFDIDIADDFYTQDLSSGSKANKMRGFWQKSDDEIVGKVLLGLIERYDDDREGNVNSSYHYTSKFNDAQRTKVLDIANNLIVGAPQQTPVQQAPVQRAPQQAPQQAPVQRAPQQAPYQAPYQQAPVQRAPQQAPVQRAPQQAPAKQRVFIVHGHDDALRLNVENFIRKIGLDPIILMDQASAGDTIIEKLENHGEADYAIVLYTACDFGKGKNDDDLKARARQNVVFEHGYFIARLTRKKVAAIVEPGVERPNDTSGIVYIGANEGWKMTLARELKSAGLIFNSEAVYA